MMINRINGPAHLSKELLFMDAYQRTSALLEKQVLAAQARRSATDLHPRNNLERRRPCCSRKKTGPQSSFDAEYSTVLPQRFDYFLAFLQSAMAVDARRGRLRKLGSSSGDPNNDDVRCTAYEGAFSTPRGRLAAVAS